MTLDEAKERYPDANLSILRDGAALTCEVNHLVCEERKTATCVAVAEFGDAPLPKPGGAGSCSQQGAEPLEVIDTVEIRRLAFDKMTDELVAEHSGPRRLAAELSSLFGAAGAFLARRAGDLGAV